MSHDRNDEKKPAPKIELLHGDALAENVRIDREKRVSACAAEIDAVLVTYGCRLVATAVIENGAMPRTDIQIIPE